MSSQSSLRKASPRSPHRHGQQRHHHHAHAHAHHRAHSHVRGHGAHHQHGHGHRPQVIQLRIFTNPRSKRSASVPDEDSVTTQSMVGVEEQMRCRLSIKMRELRAKSGNLMIPTESSDVIIQAADGNKFHCHSFVLDIWAPNLLNKAKPTESGQKRQIEVEVTDFNSNVVGACLQLMYAGGIDQMPPDLMIDIMKLAKTYQIPDLQSACLQAASAELTPANACYVWYFANLQKMEQLQKKAMQYVLENVDAIFNDPKGREAWDRMMKKPEMLLEMFYGISECTKLKPMAEPPRDTQMDELWTESNGLRQPHGFPDVSVVTKENTTFHIHLPLIALAAPKFAEAMHDSGAATGRVVINDFDGDVVEEFLRGVYRQQPSPMFSQLVDLLYALACDYEVDSLADVCEREMVKSHTNSVEEAIELLKEAEEHRMPAAKTECLRFLFNLGRQLAENQSWKNLVEQYPSLISEMIVDWESYRQRK